MISNVSHGLIQLHGNFGESVALEKMQAQSITLVFGKRVEKSFDGRISDQFGQNSGLFPPRTQIGEAFGFQIEVSIEVSRVQVAAAVNRALVGNQHKPRTKRSLLGIEDVSPAMHKQEAS